MNKWLAIPEQTRCNAYIQIAEKTGMNAFAVEKDWWVVQTLRIIFEAWKTDYKTMSDLMIYETKVPSFDELIAELKILRDKINSLPWEFEKSFPRPTPKPIIPEKQ